MTGKKPLTFTDKPNPPGYLILFVGGKRFPFAPPLPYL